MFINCNSTVFSIISERPLGGETNFTVTASLPQLSQCLQLWWLLRIQQIAGNLDNVN
jgi:hypothetical protein